jgi:DoxX
MVKRAPRPARRARHRAAERIVRIKGVSVRQVDGRSLIRPYLAFRQAAIPLRLIVGYGFIAHGYAKLSHGVGHFAGILHALAVPAPHLAAWATICVELAGVLRCWPAHSSHWRACRWRSSAGRRVHRPSALRV